MKKRDRAIIPLIVLVASLAFATTQAEAENIKYKLTNYITKIEAIPVPNQEGHLLVLAERRGVAVFEDGSVGSYYGQLMADLVKGEGPYQGYGEITYPDGAKAMTKLKGTLAREQGKKTVILKGEGEYIKGTGRLEGIKGTLSLNGRYVTPYGKETKGDIVMDVTGTYTLPSQ